MSRCISHSAVLILALGLSTASCRQRTRSVETPASSGDSGIDDTTAPTRAMAPPGTYACTLAVGERTLDITECTISESQELRLEDPNAKLVGLLRPEDYGFALEGKLVVDGAEQPIRGELFRQGAGSFAATLRVGEANLIRLSVLSKADSAAAE